jgi:hypothetical protein
VGGVFLLHYYCKEAIQPAANAGACRSPTEWDASQLSIPAATFARTVALGKRQREAGEPHADRDSVGIDMDAIPETS